MQTMPNFSISSSYKLEMKEMPVTGCTLLLGRKVSINIPYLSALHSHPFWQMEIPYSTGISVINSEQTALKSDDILIIPPKTPHRFQYQRSGIEFVTLRFQTKGIYPSSKYIIASHNPNIQSIRSVIVTLLGDQPLIDMNIIQAITALISSMVSLTFMPKQPELYHESSELVRDVTAVVRGRIGENIRILDIASEIGLSVDNLSKRFRQDTGKTLKQYIDEYRTTEAKKILLHTCDSVSEIAFQLGFLDVYSFSRFFKRMTNQTPSNYRHTVLQSSNSTHEYNPNL